VVLSVGLSLGLRIEHTMADEPHRQSASVLEHEARQGIPVGSPLANVEDFLPDPGVLPVKRGVGDDPRPASVPPRNMSATEGKPASE